ncbi:hypothetical protein ACLOJK_041872 [Asimina triloba]
MSYIQTESFPDWRDLHRWVPEGIGSLDNKFVRQSPKFSSELKTEFEQAFSGNSSRTTKGKPSSVQVVDIEAEVKDID